MFGVKRNMQDLPEDYEDVIRHKPAWERYLRMVKKKDPERYKKLAKIKPLFFKGLSIFYRKEFFKDFQSMMPMNYFNLIAQVCPEILPSIYQVPKLFLYS